MQKSWQSWILLQMFFLFFFVIESYLRLVFNINVFLLFFFYHCLLKRCCLFVCFYFQVERFALVTNAFPCVHLCTTSGTANIWAFFLQKSEKQICIESGIEMHLFAYCVNRKRFRLLWCRSGTWDTKPSHVFALFPASTPHGPPFRSEFNKEFWRIVVPPPTGFQQSK